MIRHPDCPGLSVCFIWKAACLSVMLGANPVPAATPIPGPPQAEPIAIVGGTIHPISGPPIQNGTILFADGTIQALGKSVEIPDDARRIDATGRHVYPGLFCAGGQLGLVEINSIRATRDASESGAVNPNVKAQVAINPESELIPVTRSNGVLLTLSNPTSGLVAGMSTVLMLDGWTWEDMTLHSPAALHIQWPRMRESNAWWVDQSPSEQANEREGELAQLRELFDQAEHYRQGRPEHAIDAKLEAMLPVLAGEIPLLVSADSQSQIQAAVAFAAQRQLKLIINGGYDAESCAALLRAHDVPVIIPAVYRLPRRRSDAYDASYTLPERLRAAGVKFCIAGVDDFGASNLRNLPYHAATAVAYGLPLDEAVKAVTLYPAQILGVDDRVGSLEAGKDATLIVTDGHPLETTTQVTAAFLQGRDVDLANRHTQFWEKYQEKYRRLKERGELP